jgi:hypothetical protein
MKYSMLSFTVKYCVVTSQLISWIAGDMPTVTGFVDFVRPPEDENRFSFRNVVFFSE